MHVLLREIFRAIFNLPTSPEFTGWNGERLTAQVFKKLKKRGYPDILLRNVYVPIEDGDQTTEIDALYVTRKGMYVIESKNYSGWIFGSQEDRKWMQILKGGARFPFYNPIKQNVNHIKALWRFINVNVPSIPIIAFSERCELKKINLSSSDVYVIKRDKLYDTVVEVWNNSPDHLSQEQVDDIERRLKPLTNVDEKTKKAHIEKIKKMTE